MDPLLQKHLDRAKSLNGAGAPATGLGVPLGADALGGPIGVPEMAPPMMAPPMMIRAGYKNMYGTDIGVGFDPVHQRVEGSAAVPVGDARAGLTLEARGGYDRASRGLSGFVGFKKKNLSPDRRIAEQQLGLHDPNRDKYSYGVSLNEGPGSRGMGMPGFPGGMPPGFGGPGMVPMPPQGPAPQFIPAASAPLGRY